MNDTSIKISGNFFRGRKFAQSLAIGSLLFLVFIPFFASAAINIIPCGKGDTDATIAAGTNKPCSFNDLVTLGNNVVDFLLKDVALPFAVILFMWAGFLLMFKSSSPGSMDEAKGILWNVVVGFLIALAAVLIVKFILFSLGTDEGLYKDRLVFNVVELRK